MGDTTPNSSPTPPTIRRRKLLISANVVVQTIILVLVVVMLNWLASRHYLRFDWTNVSYYKLSDKTKQVLQALKGPVEVVVFLQPSAQQPQVAKIYEDVRNLLQEFAYFGRQNLRIAYVDPQGDPHRAEQLAKQYKVDSPNVVIFAAGDRHKYVTAEELVDVDMSQMGQGYRIKAFKGEGAFLSAIQNVTEGKQAVVYFLTGHGERDPGSTDERDGYSMLSQYIKRDNLKIEPWNLTEKQALPEDAGVIVIAGPKKKLTPVELNQLDEYLQKKGGRLFILLDPRYETGLETFLAHWSVQVDNNLAMAKGGTVLGTEVIMVNALGSSYGPHPITRKLAGINTEFPYTRTVRRGEGEPAGGAAPIVTELVKTPAAYWGETDLDSKRSKFDEGQDMSGPLSLAVAVEANKPPGVELEAGQYRLVVVGTSGFVDNGGLTDGNLDFFLNSLNWLLQREALVAVGPKQPQEFRLNMSDGQAQAVKLLCAVGLPLAVAVFGFFVYLRRRK